MVGVCVGCSKEILEHPKKRRVLECRDCYNKRRRDEHKENPEKVLRWRRNYVERVGRERINQIQRNGYKRNPSRVKNNNLKRYQLTLEEFNMMQVNQNFKCLICDQTKKLYVDHCHNTGKVRGLLCMKCNTGIGMLGDNFDRVVRAAQYLKGV